MNVDQARAYAPLFDPVRLKIARELKGLKKTELARRVGVTAAALTQYETGASRPSAGALLKLSLALGQSVEFFAQDGRRSALPVHGKAFFRSLRSTRQGQRDRAEAHVMLVSEIVDELSRRVKLPPLNIPDNLHVSDADTRETIEQNAEALRAYWSMQAGPVPNMVRLLEANGIVVIHCLMDCRDVDAFSRWFKDRPLVVLNADNEHVDRLRFDAAHELGHIVMHADPEPGSGILESQAHMFAAAFLMPRNVIKNQLPTRLFWPVFRELKQTWGVSVQALLRRALDLGRLTEATYRRAMMTLSKLNQRKNETMFPLEGNEPSVLLRMAVEVLEAKGYTINDLASDTRLPEPFVREAVFSDVDTRPSVELSPT